MTIETIDPVWFGVGGTILAVAVFFNGFRLLEYGGDRRKMGMFHLAIAPAFVVMLWSILILSGEL